MKQSLRRAYPGRHDVAVLLVANLVLLLVSYALPFMQASRWLFFAEQYTLMRSIGIMLASGYIVLGVVVFLFSVAFPVGKLGMLLAVWFVPFDAADRDRALRWVSALGKWSMLDVFIVAVLVVLISARALTQATPLPGVYVFGAAIVMSMALTQWVQHLARRHATPTPTASGGN